MGRYDVQYGGDMFGGVSEAEVEVLVARGYTRDSAINMIRHRLNASRQTPLSATNSGSVDINDFSVQSLSSERSGPRTGVHSRSNSGSITSASIPSQGQSSNPPKYSANHSRNLSNSTSRPGNAQWVGMRKTADEVRYID